LSSPSEKAMRETVSRQLRLLTQDPEHTLTSTTQTTLAFAKV